MDDIKKDAAEYATVVNAGVSDPRSHRWQVPYRSYISGATREREKWEAEQSKILRGADIIREQPPIINRDQEAQS